MKPDLARTIVSSVFIVGLIALSLWVLRPFLPALVWAVMIVVATWPLMKSLERSFGGRRAPAVFVMTLGMLFLVVVPFWLAVSTIGDHSHQIVSFAQHVTQSGLPPAPDVLISVPLVGQKIHDFWNGLVAGGLSHIISYLSPHATQGSKWLLGQIGSIGGVLVEFLLMLVIASILYATGENAARTMRRFGFRLSGQRGENSVILAGQAIRSVALGVGVTAIVQTLIGGVGMALAGVPFAPLLAALMLMFCIAQIGPLPILAPAVIWMFWQDDQVGWASFLLVITLVAVSLDNLLRPLLIKRGADLPLLLILAGVIGGLLSFGLIGIFVGPVALAVTYTLFDAWLDDPIDQGNSLKSEKLLPTQEI